MVGPVADAEVELAGEPVRLLPERALLLAARGTLVVADLHWGKAATFRAAGVPVPPGSTAADLARLDAALDRTGARRLVVLGDLFHARAGRLAPATLAVLGAWRSRRAALEILLVRGNHDHSAGDPPADLGITCVDPPHAEGPFTCRHHPEPRTGDGYVLAGHLHPTVRLVGAARQRARLPCFWFADRVGVLPAFGEFTGSALIRPGPHDRVWVVAGDAVLEVPTIPMR